MRAYIDALELLKFFSRYEECDDIPLWVFEELLDYLNLKAEKQV